MISEGISFNTVAALVCTFAMITAALYACFSNRVLNVAIAMFLEVLAMGCLFLIMGHEYLALITMFAGALHSFIVFSFSSIITGNMKEANMETDAPKTRILTRPIGFLLGLSVGGFMCMVFLRSQEHLLNLVPSKATSSIGAAILGEHTVVFQLLAIAGLGLVMGLGIIIRGEENHD